jgi:hypothetical protein
MADVHHNPEPACSAASHLIAAGWERRFIADMLRAKEVTALYRSLGFEVHTEPLKPAELDPQCSDCQLAACHTYVTIYTRKARRPTTS